MADQGVEAKAPRVAIGRLDNLTRCRREAARLYCAGRRGELPAADASRLASVLGLVAALLRDQELEARVVALEQAADAR